MYSGQEVHNFFAIPETLLQSWRQFYIFKNIFHKSDNKITFAITHVPIQKQIYI